MVALTSGNSAVATVPASVTVSAGATTGSFYCEYRFCNRNTASNSIASYSGAIVSAMLTVQPLATPPPPQPALSSLSLQPSSVRGVATSQGTVTLSGVAPAGGVQIKLASSNTNVATLPASVTSPGRSQVSNLHSAVEKSKNKHECNDFGFAWNGVSNATLTVRR